MKIKVLIFFILLLSIPSLTTQLFNYSTIQLSNHPTIQLSIAWATENLGIPECAFKIGIGVKPQNPGKPEVDPTTGKEVWHITEDSYLRGTPLGGFGSGCIGRAYDGAFREWHLDIGWHILDVIEACQFSVFQRTDKKSIAQVLWAGRPERNVGVQNFEPLQSWRWSYPEGRGNYFALFPKSWFVYDWEEFPVKLILKQFSPVIPHNYKEVSFPVAVFEWRAINPTDKPIDVAVMLTWENIIGFKRKSRAFSTATRWGVSSEGNYNYSKRAGDLVGVVLTTKRDINDKMLGEFTIAAKEVKGTTITYHTTFDCKGNGSELWSSFEDDGKLSNYESDKVATTYDEIGAAISISFKLKPHEELVFPVVLAWDLPIFSSGKGTKWYSYYTKFFGTSGHNSWKIAQDALNNYKRWEEGIDRWQRPIIEDKSKPDWYKTALFNELYYLVAGGTIWENGLVKQDSKKDKPDDHKFSYLECYDYPYYSTFDVRFYGSFALAMFWPDIEKQVIYTFSDFIQRLEGITPHDLGSPATDPWLTYNSYTYRDSTTWKDLPSKFPLQVYRDYIISGEDDLELLKYCWPAIKKTLKFLKQKDYDQDGLPDNDGPDQTYDTWEMHGASSYCGSLLLAALQVAIKIADMVDDKEAEKEYKIWFKLAKENFEKKLWNGKYYNFDTKSKENYNDIMADQLVGQWYLNICRLPRVVPRKQTLSALKTIYENNVMRIAEGKRGAINGVNADGSIDKTNLQSQEIWTGTTYALASFMITEGMIEEGFKTAWGIYYTTYEDKAYFFRTPEAWNIEGDYRAQLYMRPQAIWAIEYALSQR